MGKARRTEQPKLSSDILLMSGQIVGKHPATIAILISIMAQNIIVVRTPIPSAT
jgi:hypothetical protein